MESWPLAEYPAAPHAKGLPGIIGKNPRFLRILQNICRLQKIGPRIVLISGESGTGKELLARAIHFGGKRSQGPFIPLNCATIPIELAESTLFGHIKGSFTGANAGQKGYFELAHGGTLFLDEIGDMPYVLQVKFLRIIEDSRFIPVGGNNARQVDVNIIAATNADLPNKMSAGQFRKDLYFRIARVTLDIPPLRERKEDIPLLVNHFLRIFAAQMNISPPAVSHTAMSMLMAYEFAGNVRELKNIIEQALLLSDKSEIAPEHLEFIKYRTAGSPVSDSAEAFEPASMVSRSFGRHAPAAPRIPLRPKQVEMLMIKGALAHTRGDVIAAANLLNMQASRVWQFAVNTAALDRCGYRPSDEDRIKMYLVEKGSINNSECRRLLEVDLYRASYLLKKMYRKGVLIRTKGGRWSRYLLADQPQDELGINL